MIFERSGIASVFECLDSYSNMSWQRLTRKPQRLFRCLLVEVPWQINTSILVSKYHQVS